MHRAVYYLCTQNKGPRMDDIEGALFYPDDSTVNETISCTEPHAKNHF